MTLTREQQAALNGPAYTMVCAQPGSGKTALLVERTCKQASTGNPESIVAITFSRRAANELKERISARGIEIGFIGTVHGWCLRLINSKNKKSEQLTACPPDLYEATLLKNLRLAGSQRSAELVSKGSKTSFEMLALARTRAHLLENGLIDYDTMIATAVPIIKGLAPSIRLLVDEYQDSGPVEREIYSGSQWASLFVVGDPDQCHPPGTMVRVRGGQQVAIETLKTGDEVAAWSTNSKKFIMRKIRVSEREFSGELISVKCAGKTVDATPNHRFMVRWSDRTAKTCVTYLMFRKGFGYRVGWCQLFSHCRNSNTFHLSWRARVEGADAVWILKSADNRRDVNQYESVIAAKYGIPTIMFNPCRGSTIYDKDFISGIFSAVSDGLIERGEKCLMDHGLNKDFHIFPWPGQKKGDRTGRRTIFKMYPNNLIPGIMCLVDADTGEWSPIESVTRSEYSGTVHSMSVDREQTYSANGLVVYNCLYDFRGAEVSSMDELLRVSNGFKTHGGVFELTENHRSTKDLQELFRSFNDEFTRPPATPFSWVIQQIASTKPDVVICGQNRTVDRAAEALKATGVEISTKHKPTLKQLALSAWYEFKAKADSDLLMDRSSQLAAESGLTQSDIAEFEANRQHNTNDELAAIALEPLVGPVGIEIMTCHTSKGTGFEHVAVIDDLESKPHHHRMRFVAISRAKSKLDYYAI